MRKRSTNKKEEANLKGKETKEANEAAKLEDFINGGVEGEEEVEKGKEIKEVLALFENLTDEITEISHVLHQNEDLLSYTATNRYNRNKPGSSNLAVIKILRGKVHAIKTVSRPLHSKLVKCVKEGGYFGVDGEKLKVKKRGALESIFFGWGVGVVVGVVGGGRWLWV